MRLCPQQAGPVCPSHAPKTPVIVAIGAPVTIDVRSMPADGAAAATLRGWRLKPAQRARSLPGRRRALLSTRRARSHAPNRRARAASQLGMLPRL